MIIKNFKDLAMTCEKKDSLCIIEAGLNAAFPSEPLRKIVKRNKFVIGKQTFLLSK